ncbi:hypothetical protein [Lysinibacillus xylanilyticus]|uniref:hypothetical protein n=1 Tax=Lysinibacillus xylanilyticus TaxID=582475 RepID=UPI003CFD82AA
MEIINKTIEILAETIAGDNKKSIYRSGSELVDFLMTLDLMIHMDLDFLQDGGLQ